MKVCLLNDSFPPVIDGVVNVMMNYAEHLMSDHQVEVMVGTPKYPDTDYEKYAYQVVPYPSLDTASRTSGYRTGNPFSEKAIAKMAAFKPDIIHVHCPASSMIIARILREQTGAPLILTYHTKYNIDIERVVKVKALAQESIRAMVSNIEACDEVWTVSAGAGESLKALGFSGDYRVMNNGVDFAKGRVNDALVREVTDGYDLPAGVPVFLFVGRLMTYKGLPLILDALKQVKDAGLDFRMVFVGKGPDRELLEKQAASLEITDKVIFVGPVYDRDRLRAWNTRADLFLFPSTFDTNGLVVREAAACGLASVLIRNSCASEGIIDGQNGFLIEENAGSMAEMLLRISGDLPHLHEVGQNAMNEIYMSWKDCVDEAYERYRAILDMKEAGKLPVRQTMAADVMVRGVAKTMEEQARLRQIRHDIFGDFKETAVGMMENFQDTAVGMRENIQDTAAGMRENIQDTAAGMKEKAAARREERAQRLESAEEKTKQIFREMKEEWKQASEGTERFYEIMRENDSLD